MNTVYVTRDMNNAVNGVYANPQAFPTEELPANNAEVLAFVGLIESNQQADKTKFEDARTHARTALIAFRTYRALTSPTAAQRLTFERLVCDVFVKLLPHLLRVE